jgi:hydroxyacylglutathione hydrolase
VKLFEDFYVYPWVSYEANNANTVFIDGEVPTLIDPGHAALFRNVVEGMARDGKSIDSVRLVLCTHGHPDHIEAMQLLGPHVVKAIGVEEFKHLEEGGKDLFVMTGCRMPTKPFQVLLREGTLRLGTKTLKVLLTPGHSPGSLCFYWEERGVIISGDTVFSMGVGRTDLDGGDLSLLGKSVERLSVLRAEYLIPGHGDMLKGGEGIERNFSLILNEFF